VTISDGELASPEATGRWGTHRWALGFQEGGYNMGQVHNNEIAQKGICTL